MAFLKKKRKLPIRVEDIMTSPPLVIHENEPLKKVSKMMYENRVGSVLVVDSEGKLIGIVTERDITHACAMGFNADISKVFEVMTENPITISPSAGIDEAIRVMRNAAVRHLPVVDEEGKPVGVVSMRDILDAVFSFFSTILG
ncbi:MAG: CBS domain-containing protein [Desulfurococcales archaeon]|nr:CBS domain-containing protein [Desulfurococcales archaeon]